MDKIKIGQLDIPIIRSCNLACAGCLTHSNHKNIKGLVKLEESIEWLNYWASKLNVDTVTLFGGEPLLHPQFVEWAEAVKQIFKTSMNFNTNGFYLDKLFPYIDRLFTLGPTGTALSMVITVQTTEEPYYSTVRHNIEALKQKIVEFHLQNPRVNTAEWELQFDEVETRKKWFRLLINGNPTSIGLTVCEQYNLPWCTHYQGYGEEMQPVYDYHTSIHYIPNFKRCQTKKHITLFKGEIFKCPPMGVLEHTLNTFNIQDRADWRPFIKDYKRLTLSSPDEEIAKWFEEQKLAQLVCNMCGFTGPNVSEITAEFRDHWFKKHWKITPVNN